MSLDVDPRSVASDEPTFQILALSGGGFRGLFTARVLALLEQGLSPPAASGQQGRQIADCFDLIVGTSAGGILAAGLAAGTPAIALQTALERNGPRIFDRRYIVAGIPLPIRKPRGQLGRIIRAPYDTKNLRDSINDILGDAASRPLAALKRPVLLTAVEASQIKPVVFGSGLQTMAAFKNTSTLDSILATTAAPTFFPTHHVGPNVFVDGGLIANSPAMVGVTEAIHVFGASLNRVRVLSIGTAAPSRSGTRYAPGSPGSLQWVIGRGLFLTTMEAQEHLVKEAASAILGQNFLHIDAAPTGDESKFLEMDDASMQAAVTLKNLAERSVAEVWEAHSVVLGDFLRHQAN